MKIVLIYLASDNENNWQDKVISAFENEIHDGTVEFFDPRKNPDESICKQNQREANIVFGYTQARTSELFKTCTEMTGGFYNQARTIFVDDNRHTAENFKPVTKKEVQHKFYLDFISSVSHKKATSLAEGISILKDEIGIAIIRNFSVN